MIRPKDTAPSGTRRVFTVDRSWRSLSRTVPLARVLADRHADDVDGDQPKDAVALPYRGVDYQIDLTEKNATGLDQV